MIKKISSLQKKRFIWFLMAFTSILLVSIAHSFFQHYLYMPPCEQCVYIRFAFLCMSFGGVIACINPKILILRLFGYVFGFLGSIQGIMHSLKLSNIHKAIQSENPFGVQGCSPYPHYPFGLKLDELWPGLFAPTGGCGIDSPVVPANTELSDIQSYFINLYSDGWFLLPSQKFLNMAECTLFAFGLSFILLFIMGFCMIYESIKMRNLNQKSQLS